jgi:hypothetical protein
MLLLIKKFKIERFGRHGIQDFVAHGPAEDRCGGERNMKVPVSAIRSAFVQGAFPSLNGKSETAESSRFLCQYDTCAPRPGLRRRIFPQTADWIFCV